MIVGVWQFNTLTVGVWVPMQPHNVCTLQPITPYEAQNRQNSSNITDVDICRLSMHNAVR